MDTRCVSRPGLSSSFAADKAGVISTAVEALAAGELVVIPTETVYGVAASAASAEGVSKLKAATAAARGAGVFGPVAWHAPSVEVAHKALGSLGAVHARLVDRLLPGPVTFVVEAGPARAAEIRSRVRSLPGTVDDERDVCVRVPGHAETRELLAAAWKRGIPVIAESVAATGWGDGKRVPGGAGAADVAVVIDDGPTRFGGPSTRVRLRADGGFDILRVGALEERAIKKALEKTILFVCTGNTCRSPMAAAIARSLVPAEKDGVTTKVRSAGVFASGGEPITPESVRALKAIGIDTKEAEGHRSHDLTRQMIADAEVIYAMTAQHAREVKAMDPSSVDKVKTLDPSGQDVPDPIGGTQEVYTRTAERLKSLIERRLRGE